ncbi:hypothetical protein NW754_16781 [Fusarium falciforme]|nr:hypothetical protein NW754_16781 [Fusarium falciforme]
MIAPVGCLVPSRSSNANMVMNGCKGIKHQLSDLASLCAGINNTHSADAAAGHGRAGRDLEDRAHCAVVGSAEARLEATMSGVTP